MSGYETANVNTYAPYQAYAECASAVRSPLSAHGLDHAAWTEQYRDKTLSDAVQLNAFKGLACERVGNGPERDEQYFSVIVEQRPIFELPPPVTMESDNVPTIFQTQVANSCGFDVGEDGVYSNTSYVIYCANGRP
jgi:hypothetical protein